MVDVHSHLLPMIDDGAEDIDELNMMLGMYEVEGVDRIVASAHFMPGRFDNCYEDVCLCIDALGLGGRVLPGQEVFLDGGTLGACREGLVRGINGSDYLLVELGFDFYREEYVSYVIELMNMGFRVVVAHPERYGYFVEDPVLLNDLIDVGCFFQVNSSSVEGLLGSKVRKFVFRMARAGLVDFLGSDAHGSRGRVPRLREAKAILGKEFPGLGEIVEGNALAMVEGRDLVRQERKVFVKKRFWF